MGPCSQRKSKKCVRYGFTKPSRADCQIRKVQEYNALSLLPKVNRHEVPGKRIDTEVDSARPLYNTPCHLANPESRGILGLVSALPEEEDTFAPPT